MRARPPTSRLTAARSWAWSLATRCRASSRSTRRSSRSSATATRRTSSLTRYPCMVAVLAPVANRSILWDEQGRGGSPWFTVCFFFFFFFARPAPRCTAPFFLGGQGHPVRDRGRSRGHERRDFARIGDQRMTVCLSGALRPSLFLKQIFVSCLPTLSLTRTRTRRPRPPLALGAGDHQPRGPGRGRGPDPGAVYGTRPAGAAVFSICFSQCLSLPPPASIARLRSAARAICRPSLRRWPRLTSKNKGSLSLYSFVDGRDADKLYRT